MSGMPISRQRSSARDKNPVTTIVTGFLYIKGAKDKGG